MTERTEKPGSTYGYVVVFASFVVMTMTFGLNYSFGVFFKPLLAEFGWTRAETSAAYSMMTLFAGLFGILAGRIADFFGPRIIGILGGTFLCAGFLLMSLVHRLWHFYLFYGLVMAVGVGGCWPGLMPSVAKWFADRRGLMSGIVASGIGFGTIVVPPLAEVLIARTSWRLAYIMIGLLTLVLVLGVSTLLKDGPSHGGEGPPDGKGPETGLSNPEKIAHGFGEAARSGPFWLLCAVYFCYGYCLHTVMVHIAPYAQDLGLSPSTSAAILAIVGATSIISRIIFGGASDRLGVKPSLITGLIVMVVAYLWVQAARTLWPLYVFGIFFGIAYGGVIAMQALAAARLFGLHSLGVILGTITFAYTLGGAAGPVISGYIFDLTGSYNRAFLVGTVVAFISLALALLLKIPRKSTKIKESFTHHPSRRWRD